MTSNEKNEKCYRKMIELLWNAGLTPWQWAYPTHYPIKDMAAFEKSMKENCFKNNYLGKIIFGTYDTWMNRIAIDTSNDFSDEKLNPILNLGNDYEAEDIISFFRDKPYNAFPLTCEKENEPLETLIKNLFAILLEYERFNLLFDKPIEDSEFMLDLARPKAEKIKKLIDESVRSRIPTEKYASALKNFIEDYEQTVLTLNEKYHFSSRKLICIDNSKTGVQFYSKSTENRIRKLIKNKFIFSTKRSLVMEAIWTFTSPLKSRASSDLIKMTENFLIKKLTKNIGFALIKDDGYAFTGADHKLKMKFGLNLEDLGKSADSIETFIPDEMIA